jgi:hypothetical protein
MRAVMDPVTEKPDIGKLPRAKVQHYNDVGKVAGSLKVPKRRGGSAPENANDLSLRGGGQGRMPLLLVMLGVTLLVARFFIRSLQ